MSSLAERLRLARIPATQPITKLIEAQAIAHTLSKPSKMPGFGYSLPAAACNVGSRLRPIEGSVCNKCYALKGRYVFDKTQHAMTLRLFAINHPRWVEAMVFQINYMRRRKPGADHFRWHDSGDIQSLQHLANICQVAEQTPEIKHWMPTREIKLLNLYTGNIPKNLTIRVSAPMVGDYLQSTPFPQASVGVTEAPSVFQCGAYTKDRGGKCGDCRACWDPNVTHINYPLH
ncbi:MAG: hypothetical protein GC184_06205 [Rhizobiales bacterium]|nr:hypothetical protein [Hyphomicrobiales bacterium]